MEQRRYSVLKAGKMENCKDFSEFNKRPNWVRASPELQLLWGVPAVHWSVSIKTGSRKQQW